MRDVDGVLRRASRTFSPHRVDEVYVNVSTALFIEAEDLRFGALELFRVLDPRGRVVLYYSCEPTSSSDASSPLSVFDGAFIVAMDVSEQGILWTSNSFSTMVTEFRCSTWIPGRRGACLWRVWFFMEPERRIVDGIGGWLPLKVVLPMPRGGVRLLAGPLAPVDVFKVLVGPEFFWDEADGAAPPPWDGIFTDDLFCLVVGGRGWNLRTLGQWRALDENSGFLASSDVPWWRTDVPGLLGAVVAEFQILPVGEVCDLRMRFTNGYILEVFSRDPLTSWRLEGSTVELPVANDV